ASLQVKTWSIPRSRVELPQYPGHPPKNVGRGILSSLSSVLSWVRHYVAQGIFWIVSHLWFVVGNAFCLVWFSFLCALRELWRFFFYVLKLLRQIVIGFLRVCWLSSLVMLTGVAVAFLVFLLPTAISAVSLNEFALAAASISDMIHQQN